MSSADGRRRELANFEIDIKPRKKASAAQGTKKSASAKPAASSAGKKPAAAKRTGTSAKSANPAAKKASGGTKAAASASKKSMDGRKNVQKKIHVEENPLARRESAVAVFDVPADVVPPVQRRSAAVKAAPPQRRSAPRSRDAYDEFDFEAPVRKKNPPHKKKKRRKKRSPFSPMTLVLLLIIGGMAGLGVWRVNEYEVFQQMKAVVSSQTFYQGTTVEGVDVSGMTLPEALTYWDTKVEPAYRETAAVLNDGTRLTAAQMGYSSDYVNTLSAAWNAGRTGSLVERYRRVALHMESPKSYEVERSLFDDEVVRSYAEQLAQQVNTEARSAKLESFDTATQTFTYSTEQVGRTLDQQKLVQDIEAALSAGGGNVLLEIAAVQPEVTAENIAAQYGQVSYAVTNASSSSSNRLNNIALALQMIDGTCLEPGDTFSFNEVVGKRTKDRGFKSAPAYNSGEVTEEIGGGICQVSTTLFNAAVKADMEIKERHSHSLTVSYVDLGKDAAVDWGNKDLKFTNTSDDKMYICCYLSEDKRVHIGVYGKLLENGVTITLEGKKTGTVEPETQYQMNFMMASGESKVIQKGKDGYSAAAYKIWWDANGNEIKRELLCKSNYKATPKIVEYGP